MTSQRRSKPSGWPQDNVLLVAAGVDYQWLSAFSGAATSMQIPLDLVALHHEEESSEVVCYLSDLDDKRFFELLIIPQGEACMKHLLVDPRVHTLINDTVDHGGRVAFGAGAELVLSQMPIKYRFSSEQVSLQRNLSTAEFAQHLLSQNLISHRK